MKIPTIALVLAGALASRTLGQASAAPPSPAASASAGAPAMPLEEARKKASYMIGRQIGSDIVQKQVEPDLDSLVQGMRDASAGKPSAVTDEEARTAMEVFRQSRMQVIEETRKNAAAQNAKAGEAFLEENKKKEGWKVTESGLQYKVEKEGTGASPKGTDTVSVHYTGTLIDGTKFDSSLDHGSPAEFQVGGVIPGWTEALKLMKVGSKWKLAIPSKLAYGERGAQSRIGPNSTLLFDVELLGIK